MQSPTGWAPTKVARQSSTGMFAGAHPVRDFGRSAIACNRPQGGLLQKWRENRLRGCLQERTPCAIPGVAPSHAIAHEVGSHKDNQNHRPQGGLPQHCHHGNSLSLGEAWFLWELACKRWPVDPGCPIASRLASTKEQVPAGGLPQKSKCQQVASRKSRLASATG